MYERKIKTDLEDAGCEDLDWTDCMENTEQWRFLVHIVMYLRFYKWGVALDSATYCFWKSSWSEWVRQSNSLVPNQKPRHETDTSPSS
jgi:hypothetical protein